MKPELIGGPALVLALAFGTASNARDPAPELPARPELVAALPAPPPEHAGTIVVPKDTMVRLMVLNEVNTHRARLGDRFVLRVDEDVTVNGTTVVPVGARAFGEVTLVKPNGAVGKAGTLGARLLYLELGDARIPLSGEDESKGSTAADRVVLAAGAFGPFGLLVRGSQGKLKAGHIFNGFIAEQLLFDPATGRLVAPEPEPPAEP